MRLWALTIFILFAKLHISAANHADCDHIITRDDDIYILSDQPTTYQEAVETCQSYGGNLAQISSQDEREFFEPHLQRIYIPDSLTSVNISVKDDERYVGVFRSSAENRESDRYLTRYIKPNTGELNRFMLYNTSEVQDFNQSVRFCRYFDGYTKIHRDCIKHTCDGGWIYNFRLYGGTPQTSKTIQVYNYYGRGEFSKHASKLTLNTLRKRIFKPPPSLSFVYLPDISVFTGARSDVGQSSWFWNNGTMITNTTYHPINTSVCQQMTWPLTYDDGINLRTKECESEESHYICSARVSSLQPIVEEVECDETSLRLSFTNSNTGTFLNGIIQIDISDGRIMNIPMGISSTTIGNLTQRTKYTLKLNAQFEGCSFDPTVTVLGRTGYNEPVPDPVTSATAVNTRADLCSLLWSKVDTVEDEISYKITSTSNVTKETKTIMPSSIPGEAQDLGGFITHIIDLSSHGYNNNVSFEIQAVTSCGKTSESVDVNGICVSPMQQPVTGLFTLVISGLLVAVLAMLKLLVLVILIRKRKSNQRERAAMGMSENEACGQPKSMQDNEAFKQSHTYETVMSNTYENIA